MALARIPDEINRHIEAVLALSKRDVLLKVLRQAEFCLQSEQPTAAAVLAGVALDELSLTLGQGASEQQHFLNVWRELRDQAAHPSPGAAQPDTGALKTMITGIRDLIEQVGILQSKATPLPIAEDTLTKIRGKYEFVPTSVDTFLERKREDLDLENRR